MLKKLLIIAPHADDELLGCGGTALKRAKDGVEVGWLLATSINEQDGYTLEKVKERKNEIENVRIGLNIKNENLYLLDLPPAKIDQISKSELVEKISNIFNIFKPEEIFIPYSFDIHSDHRVLFEAIVACTKWFRYPFIKRILAYETLSETDFVITPGPIFKPNYFVDITNEIKEKVELLKIYSSEIAQHPFPRSIESIEALAKIRGAQSGFYFAEAFELLKEIE